MKIQENRFALKNLSLQLKKEIIIDFSFIVEKCETIGDIQKIQEQIRKIKEGFK
jgi:protoheme ferro-lyase